MATRSGFLFFFQLGDLVAIRLFHVKLQRMTWWHLDRLMLDCEGQLDGH